MAYDAAAELKRVKTYYAGDPLQKRFSALVTGETNAGKTFLLRTARLPVHIDSFDPGGTKGLRDLIASGDIVADTRYENDDPFDPKAYADWKKATDVRFQIGYYNQFGTYCLDSATTFGMAVMNYGLANKSRAGESPQMRVDYSPQKTEMTNYFRKLMNLPCDFILTGHLREMRKVLSVDTKTGVVREEVKFRFYTTGQAVITIPLLFDEIYVITGKQGSDGPRREMLIDSLGEYIARSRLKSKGLLNSVESPDIKALLKKSGFEYGDKPKLQVAQTV
jgi:hypothetical protein